MSLTSHLKDKDSPVRLWIDERFPGGAAFLKEARRALPDDSYPTILPAGNVSPPTTGAAFDYRLRYYFAATSPRELVAWAGASETLFTLLERDDPDHPALWRDPFVDDETGITFATPPDPDDPDLRDSGIVQFFEVLGELVDRAEPAARRLTRADEDELDRACCVLAMLEQARRAGLLESSPLATLNWDSPVGDLLALVPQEWIDDLARLSWAFYDHFSSQLSRPAILNPVFAGSAAVGGADADLIWDGCLIDVKTSSRLALDLGWLRQLLGYVMLDWEDEYGIDSVGIYLSRHVHLASWPLRLLIERAGAPRGPDLAALRSDFRARFEFLEDRIQEGGS